MHINVSCIISKGNFYLSVGVHTQEQYMKMKKGTYIRKEAQSSFNSHLMCTAPDHRNTQKRQHTYNTYRNNSTKKQTV